tara:strand:- start:282 stop:614 length:333 start_codon:yes stop_codon:yes gene_type:complete
MRDPKYGTMKKKVIFYDSDKRYADLKIRLEHDGLSQPKFFRGLLTGYLSRDPDILNYIDKLKSASRVSKKRIKEDRELIKKGEEKLDTFSLGSGEIESIFDILEKENPNL